jgi:hypothetical protein
MANTTWSATDKTATTTLSGGNLVATATGNAAGRATDRQVAGKFYWEVTANTIANPNTGMGVANPNAVLSTVGPTPVNACLVYRNSAIYLNGVTTGISLGLISAGNVIGIALDLINNTIWFRLGAAGNWNANASYNPATNTGGIGIGSVGGGAVPLYPLFTLGASAEQVTANFGDSAFSGAVPSGFTSGFTAGASIPTNELATQLVLEQWGRAAPPPLQLTQIAIEQWAQVSTSTGPMAVTQMLLEQWASVALAGGAQPRVCIMA